MIDAIVYCWLVFGGESGRRRREERQKSGEASLKIDSEMSCPFSAGGGEKKASTFGTSASCIKIQLLSSFLLFLNLLHPFLPSISLLFLLHCEKRLGPSHSTALRFGRGSDDC